MRIPNEVTLHRVTNAIYRLLAAAIGEKRVSRVLSHRFGGQTLGNTLYSWYQHLERPAATDPILIDGHQIYHGNQTWSLQMAYGLYEPKTVRLVRRLLRPGMTFVDVGAHIGWCTLLAARAVGEAGHIYAFEPEPSTLDLLRKNVAVNGYEGSVTLVGKAVWDVSGSASMVGATSSMYSSMYASPAEGAAPITVEATTLDEFFGERDWPRVDLIKMDIEGAQGAALQGMRELSRRNPGIKLIVEYLPLSLEIAGETPHRFFEILEGLGFSRKSIISWRLIPVECSEDIGSTLGTRGANLLCEKEGRASRNSDPTLTRTGGSHN